MSSLVKTTEEFSTSRKVRYGVGRGNSPTRKGYTIGSPASSAALSPHKHYYGQDQDGQQAYFIEFNIGEFQFDEITIRTEGQHLIVQGKSKIGDKSDPEEFNKEFKRNFTLPADVDQYSIKAQLDETTRQLTLIGHVGTSQQKLTSQTETVVNNEEVLGQAFGNFSLGGQTIIKKTGAMRENRQANSIEYEIYLGADLKDGVVNVELSGYNNLSIKVSSKGWDKYGDFGVQLSRQIKLPTGSDPHKISHGIDNARSTLLVKLPIKQ